MSLTNSSYPLVAQALVDLLKEEVDANVQVLRGAPMKLMGSDNILIGGIEKGSHVFATARPGRRTRDEQYWLVVNITCKRASSDPTLSETAALDLFAALENVVSEDASLGIDSTLRANIEEFEMDSFVEDAGGWRTLLVAKVQVRVRLV